MNGNCFLNKLGDIDPYIKGIKKMNSLDILISIRKIVRAINIESKKVQKAVGLSIPQLLCLTHIKEKADKKVTHKDLMELLSLNSSTVTGIINRLQKKGFIKREQSKLDKRFTYIYITEEGEKILDNAPKILHNRLSDNLNKLDVSHISQIKNNMDLLISLMNIEKIDASPMVASNTEIASDT